MLQRRQEYFCPYNSELHDLAFDKDIDSQHMTVERILRDSNVNAWNQDDQYVVQRQGIDTAFAHDNVGFEARCHVGLTAKRRALWRDNTCPART